MRGGVLTDKELVERLREIAGEIHEVGKEMLENHQNKRVLVLQLRVSASDANDNGWPNATVRLGIDGKPILLFGDWPKHP